MNTSKISSGSQLWSQAQALAHLRLTFEQACMSNAELMEPYIVMRVEAAGDPAEEMAVMRQALRETVAARYPYKLMGGRP